MATNRQPADGPPPPTRACSGGSKPGCGTCSPANSTGWSWTAQLLGDAKERAFISCASTERLAALSTAP